MLFLIVATFCTLAGCGGVCCLNTLLLPTFRECAEENEITKDVLQNVRKDIEVAMPGDDVKCFYRCLLTKTGLVDDDKLNVEKVTGIALDDNDIDEATVKKHLDACKSIIQGAGTCDESWDLVKCYFTQMDKGSTTVKPP